MMMVPEAWERLSEREVTPERRAFYQYHSALVEPWDGPAAITYTDGRFVGTILDRNGLRPARYVVLDNGYVISSSEVGAVAYDEARVVKKGSLGPGQIFCVDTGRGMIMEDEEITQHFASRQPYDRWVQQNLIDLDALVRESVETVSCPFSANRHPCRLTASPGLLRLHQRGDGRGAAAHGDRGQGAGRRHGRRHPGRRAEQTAASALSLLQATLCRGDQPAHRPAARSDGDEHAYAAGRTGQSALRKPGGHSLDQAAIAAAPAGTDGGIDGAPTAGVRARGRRCHLVAAGRSLDC